MTNKTYFPYHLHSEYSSCTVGFDSLTHISEYIKWSVEHGFSHVSFSEHGNVYNWVYKKQKVEEAGLHYVHSAEFYVTERILPEDKEYIDNDGNYQTEKALIRDNYHVVIIAKNYDGVKELNRLSSLSFNRDDGHYYYEPRITFDELFNTSDNLIITTACVAGMLGRKSNPQSREKAINFLEQNKHRCFLEIQHHNTSIQKEYNKYMMELHDDTGIPLIAGTDTHSVDDRFAEARLVAEHGKGVSYPDEEDCNLIMMTYDELCKEYDKQGVVPRQVYLEAIENTNILAGMIEDFTLDMSYKYPKIYDSANEVLWSKIIAAYNNHPYARKRYTWDDVVERVTEEYNVICETGSTDFILLQNHVREWERENDVIYGFGRGSVGGSFICYLLQITAIDSIKYNLPFSRFMSKERVSLADIDTDYDDESKAKVTHFICHDHLNLPQMHTCQIITFGTMQVRTAIEYYGKGLGMSLTEVDKFKDMLDDDDNITDEMRKENPKLCELCDLTNGVVIKTGIHASGLVVSDRFIDEEFGVCTSKSTPYLVSQIEMGSLDRLAYVKFDILGLQNLKLITLASEYAGLPKPTPDNDEFSDLNDIEVYRDMRTDTTMIFQFESAMAFNFIFNFFSEATMGKVLRRLGDIDLFRMLAISNAALRPSGTAYRDLIAQGEFVDYELKEFNDFLDPTFGRLIFQESITGWLQKFCGYTGGEADVIRRAIAKKHPEDLERIIPEIRERFLKTMVSKYSADRKQSEQVIMPFIQTIEDASNYAFNQAHSVSYSSISYISAWQRHYYPLEWATAGLNAFVGNIERTANITNYAKKRGIRMLPPKFRHSRNGYAFEKETNSIFKGLSSIKTIGVNTGKSLYQLRDNQYESFIDLLVDIKKHCGKDVNSAHVKTLIKLDFFSEFGDINALLRTADMFYTVYKSGEVKQYKNMKKDTAKKSGVPCVLLEKFAEKTTDKQYTKVDMYAVLRAIERNMKSVSTPRRLKDKIKDQFEYLGYIDIVDRVKYKNVVYVQKVHNSNPKYTPRLTVYCLANGGVVDIKIPKSKFTQSRLKEEDIIVINTNKSKYQPKWIYDRDNGTFKKSSTEKELWVYDYNFLTGDEYYHI